VVKEGCLDPTKTSCTDKYKWLTATSAIKIGNIQVPMELKGNYEVIITLDAGGDPKAIKLLTADNKGISLTSSSEASWTLKANGVGEGSVSGFSRAWKGGYTFNEVKLTVQQGTTQSNTEAYLNGVAFEKYCENCVSLKLEKDQVFNKISFEGFTTNDRIIDVKIRSLSTVAACSNGSSTIVTNPITGTTNTSNLPQIASNLDIKIPRGLYSQSGGLFTPAGSIPIWADLKYVPQGSQHLWTLTGAGVLPQ